MLMAKYGQVVEKLASVYDLSNNAGEERALEAELLSGGAIARTAILAFVLKFGDGKSPGWWKCVERLVRLIPRFKTADSELRQSLRPLLEMQSGIAEYEMGVKLVVREILSVLDKPQAAHGAAPAALKTEKIDRRMTPAAAAEFANTKPLRSYKCAFFGNRIDVTPDGVALNGWWFIPFGDIREVVAFPVLESAPARGGCLKFVTDDNPSLPVRDEHSFHIPGDRNGRGAFLISENCFWFNCGAPHLCAGVNSAAVEIKTFVESNINIQ